MFDQIGLNYNLNISNNVNSSLITNVVSTSTCDGRHTTPHSVDQVAQGVIAQLEPLLAWGMSQFCRFCYLTSQESTARCSLSHRCSIGLQFGESGWRLMQHCYTILLLKITNYHDTMCSSVIILITKIVCEGSASPWVQVTLTMFKYTAQITLQSRITNWDPPPAWKACFNMHWATTPIYGILYSIFVNASPRCLFVLTCPSTRYNKNLDSSSNNTWC